ncbi:MAG: sulfatase-like hydrolase/transferase, partial [Planctomycetes bacterium]|nr:sulfatase-like hydrolase/transferase [Planctomycetota bacterium]
MKARNLKKIWMRFFTGLVVLVSIGLFTGCGPGSPSYKNLLVITMDTTRADHLGCYGYPIDITPNLDRLAAKGALFENVYAPMPQTLPSHATIFTGLGPRQHQALENVYTLAPQFQTFAETAQDKGFTTGAFIGALVLERASGMDQG